MAKAKKTDVEGGITLTVKGPRDGRWRAGIKFGSEPETVTVTPEQADMIRQDPALTVVEAPAKT